MTTQKSPLLANQPSEIDKLAFAIELAKADESAARKKRIDLEARFAPLIGAYRKARFAGQRYYFTEPPE